MKKSLKILLLILGIILALLVIGYLAIKSYLTPERVTSIAQRMASEAIKQPVEIGRVGLRIGFKTGITIDDVSLPNVEGFHPGPMIQIDKTALNLKLLPLLQRKIVIGDIDLSGMRLNLEKNKENRLNIAAIIPRELKGTNWSFSLSSIDISKGEIGYVDSTTKIELQVRDINQHIKFKGNKIVVAGEQSVYILKTKVIPELIVEVKNNLEYDTLKKNINIKKLTAVYESILLDVSGSIEEMERLSFSAVLKISDMSKIIPLIPNPYQPKRLNGKLKTECSILGTIKKPKIDGRCELKNVLVAPKGMNQEVEKIQASLSFDQNSIRNIIVQGQMGATKFDVSGSVENLKRPLFNLIAEVTGNLHDLESITDELKGIKIKGPMQVKVTIKGTTKNPSYFGEFRVKDGFIDGIGLGRPLSDLLIRGTVQKDAAKIEECSAHIGRSDFSFNGWLKNFKKPVIQMSCRSNIIDLDELLPKSKATKKEMNAKPISLTLQGNVRVNKLTGMDMEFRDINTNIRYESGIIDLKNCSAETFDGKVNFDFYYDAKSPEPYRISTRMQKISAKKILKRFLNFENLDGTINGMGNFHGRGFGKKEICSNLSASGNFKVDDGSFNNFKFLGELLAWLGIKDYKELKFNDLTLSFNIDNGKTKVSDWALSSSMGNFLTNGTIGLDGRINLDIITTLSKQYSDIVKKYHGDWLLYFDKSGRAVIDLTATGKLNSPKFRLDKTKIDKRLKGKLKDEFNEKKKEWEKKLKGLLKGKG